MKIENLSPANWITEGEKVGCIHFAEPKKHRALERHKGESQTIVGQKNRRNHRELYEGK